MTAALAVVEPVVYSKRRRAMRAAWVRLVREAPVEETAPAKIRGPADVVRLLRPRAAVELVEVFYCVALGAASNVLAVCEVTRGVVNSSLVHPREVFRIALALGASGIVIGHNHPSGDPSPSIDDRTVTRQLVDAGRLLDVPVYDHVILGAGERYTSMAEAGLL